MKEIGWLILIAGAFIFWFVIMDGFPTIGCDLGFISYFLGC